MWSACSAGSLGDTLGWTYLFGAALGLRRPDLRPGHALPRHVARHGRGAWLLRRLRHPAAADLQDLRPNIPVAESITANRLHRARPDHAGRRGGLSGRHLRSPRSPVPPRRRKCPPRTETEIDQGVQLQEGHPGRHLLRHHERLLQLRPHRRRTDRQGLRRRRHRMHSGPACQASSS